MLAGFNLLLRTTHLTEDRLPQCEAIKAAGYDGVEVPVFGGTPVYYADLGAHLDQLGAPSASCRAPGPTPCPKTPTIAAPGWIT